MSLLLTVPEINLTENKIITPSEFIKLLNSKAVQAIDSESGCSVVVKPSALTTIEPRTTEKEKCCLLENQSFAKGKKLATLIIPEFTANRDDISIPVAITMLTFEYVKDSPEVNPITAIACHTFANRLGYDLYLSKFGISKEKSNSILDSCGFPIKNYVDSWDLHYIQRVIDSSDVLIIPDARSSIKHLKNAKLEFAGKPVADPFIDLNWKSILPLSKFNDYGIFSKYLKLNINSHLQKVYFWKLILTNFSFKQEKIALIELFSSLASSSFTVKASVPYAQNSILVLRDFEFSQKSKDWFKVFESEDLVNLEIAALVDVGISESSLTVQSLSFKNKYGQNE